MKVFLIRHALSNKNLTGRQGTGRLADDWRLTQDGVSASRLLSVRLARLVHFGAMYCSTSTAAIQTAETLSDVQNLTPILREGLNSIDLGEVSGKSDEEIAAINPSVSEQIRLYHSGMWHPKSYDIPGAESHDLFESRIRASLQEIVRSGIENTCVVAHRSAITMAINIVANWPNRTAKGFYEIVTLPPLAISILELSDGCEGDIRVAGRELDESLSKELVAILNERKRDASNRKIADSSYRLGISFGTHDTSACLLRGDSVQFAVEEEKLRGEKGTTAFPSESVRLCLENAGISIDQIVSIALPADLNQYSKAANWLEQSGKADIGEVGHISNTISELECGNILRSLNAPAGVSKCVRYYRHHIAHAAHAYFMSGLSRAAVLVIDGSGEFDTISIIHARGDSFETVASTQFPHSLGKLYGAVCRHLGFKGHSKEGKVMGLAAYGRPRFLQLFHSFAEWSTGLPSIDGRYFDFGLTPLHPSVVSPEFVQLIGPAREATAQLTAEHMDIAASLQTFLEESVVRIGRFAHQLTGEKALCYGGGVALNCLVNRRLREDGPFKVLFVPPGANDAGLSIGAAYLSLVQRTEPRDALDAPHFIPPYLGHNFTSSDVVEAASELQLIPIDISSPGLVAARLLCEHGVVGWVQGRLEFGQRALGNRSILGDPRRPEIRDVLNASIKDRESFRPFGPAVLREALDEIFESATESPYMLDAFKVNAQWRDRIPAAVHVDGTSRLQTVSPATNFLFYQLLRHFQDMTGVPVLINTSFNGRDEPIAAGPREALRMFDATDLQHVIVGNYLFTKVDSRARQDGRRKSNDVPDNGLQV